MPGKPITNSFTILSGEYRRKSLSFYGDTTLRPTPNRVRETLFNWLQFDISGARVLDCFSGSGALGFEAYSRGATSVTLIEQHPQTIQTLQASIHSLAPTRELTLLSGNFFEVALSGTYDVIFIDPPFHTNLIDPTLKHIMPFAHERTLVYIESEYQVQHSNLEILKQKKAGEVHYALMRFQF